MDDFSWKIILYPPTNIAHAPGSRIKLTWKIRNNGRMPWPQSISLLQVVGIENLQQRAAFKLPRQPLQVDQDCTLTLNMTVPNATATFGYRLIADDGNAYKSGATLYFTVFVNASGRKSDKKDQDSQIIAQGVSSFSQASVQDFATILIQKCSDLGVVVTKVNMESFRSGMTKINNGTMHESIIALFPLDSSASNIAYRLASHDAQCCCLIDFEYPYHLMDAAASASAIFRSKKAHILKAIRGNASLFFAKKSDDKISHLMWPCFNDFVDMDGAYPYVNWREEGFAKRFSFMRMLLRVSFARTQLGEEYNILPGNFQLGITITFQLVKILFAVASEISSDASTLWTNARVIRALLGQLLTLLAAGRQPICSVHQLFLDEGDLQYPADKDSWIYIAVIYLMPFSCWPLDRFENRVRELAAIPGSEAKINFTVNSGQNALKALLKSFLASGQPVKYQEICKKVSDEWLREENEEEELWGPLEGLGGSLGLSKDGIRASELDALVSLQAIEKVFHIIPSIPGLSIAHALKYLQDSEHGRAMESMKRQQELPLRRSRLMVVGEVGTGKSSLVHALCDHASLLDGIGGTQSLQKISRDIFGEFYGEDYDEEMGCDESPRASIESRGTGLHTKFESMAADAARSINPRTQILEANFAGLDDTTAADAITFSVWDFAGGLVEFRLLHRTISSRHGVLVLVFNLQNLLDPEEEKRSTSLGEIQLWLQEIHSLSCEAVSGSKPAESLWSPPILLVGTHKRMVEEAIVDYGSKVSALLVAEFGATEVWQAVVPNDKIMFFPIENLDNDDESIKSLRRVIVQQAQCDRSGFLQRKVSPEGGIGTFPGQDNSGRSDEVTAATNGTENRQCTFLLRSWRLASPVEITVGPIEARAILAQRGKYYSNSATSATNKRKLQDASRGEELSALANPASPGGDPNSGKSVADDATLTVTISFDYFENFWCAKLGGRVSSCQGSPVLFFEPSGVVFGDGAQLEVRVPCGLRLGTDEEVSRGLKLFTTTQAFEDAVQGMSSPTICDSDCPVYPQPLALHWEEEARGDSVTVISNVAIVGASKSTEAAFSIQHSTEDGSSVEDAFTGAEKGSFVGSTRVVLTGAQRFYSLRLKHLSSVFVATSDRRTHSYADYPKVQFLYSQPLDRSAMLDYKMHLDVLRAALKGSRKQLQLQFGNITVDSFTDVVDFSSLIIHFFAPVDEASGMLALQKKDWTGEVLTKDAFKVRIHTCWGKSRVRDWLRQGLLAPRSKLNLDAKRVKLLTCYARGAADVFVDQGVPHVISANKCKSIPEKVGQLFAATFYSHLLNFHSDSQSSPTVQQCFATAVAVIDKKFGDPAYRDLFVLLPSDGDHNRSIFDDEKLRDGPYMDCTRSECELYSTACAPQYYYCNEDNFRKAYQHLHDGGRVVIFSAEKGGGTSAAALKLVEYISLPSNAEFDVIVRVEWRSLLRSDISENQKPFEERFFDAVLKELQHNTTSWDEHRTALHCPPASLSELKAKLGLGAPSSNDEGSPKVLLFIDDCHWRCDDAVDKEAFENFVERMVKGNNRISFLVAETALMKLRVDDGVPSERASDLTDRSDAGKVSKRSWCRLSVETPSVTHMGQLLRAALPAGESGFKSLLASQQEEEELWHCVRGNPKAIARLGKLICENDARIMTKDQPGHFAELTKLALQARRGICWAHLFSESEDQACGVSDEPTVPAYPQEWNSIFSRGVTISAADPPQTSIAGLSDMEIDSHADPSPTAAAHGGDITDDWEMIEFKSVDREGEVGLTQATPTRVSPTQPSLSSPEKPTTTDGKVVNPSEKRPSPTDLQERLSFSSHSANKIAQLDNRASSLSSGGGNGGPPAAVVVIPPDICCRLRIRISSLCPRSKGKLSFGITPLVNYKTWEDTERFASDRFFGGGTTARYTESGLWAAGVVYQSKFNPRCYINGQLIESMLKVKPARDLSSDDIMSLSYNPSNGEIKFELRDGNDMLVFDKVERLADLVARRGGLCNLKCGCLVVGVTLPIHKNCDDHNCQGYTLQLVDDPAEVQGPVLLSSAEWPLGSQQSSAPPDADAPSASEWKDGEACSARGVENGSRFVAASESTVGKEVSSKMKLPLTGGYEGLAELCQKVSFLGNRARRSKRTRGWKCSDCRNLYVIDDCIPSDPTGFDPVDSAQELSSLNLTQPRVVPSMTIGPSDTLETRKEVVGDETEDSIVAAAAKDFFADEEKRFQMPCSSDSFARVSRESTMDGVMAMSLSQDDRLAVSGTGDTAISIWDMFSGVLIRRLEGHSADVKSVSFSPDGRGVVSGSADASVRIWDASSGAILRILVGHFGDVNSVSFSPDSSRVVSGSFDNTIRVWEASSGALICCLEGHTACVRCVAFSPDGSNIASGSDDRSIRVWDVSSGALLRLFKGHCSEVYSIWFSPDGSKVVSGSFDKSIIVWDASSGALLKCLDGQLIGLRMASFSADGSKLLCGQRDKSGGSVGVWDASLGAVLRTLRGRLQHMGLVNSVSISPEGCQVICGSSSKSAGMWEEWLRKAPVSQREERTDEGKSNPSAGVKSTASSDSLLDSGPVAEGKVVKPDNIVMYPSLFSSVGETFVIDLAHFLAPDSSTDITAGEVALSGGSDVAARGLGDEGQLAKADAQDQRRVYELKILRLPSPIEVRVGPREAATIRAQSGEDKLMVTISFDYFENFWCAKLGGRVSSCQGSPVLFFEPSGVVFGDGAQLEVRVPCGLRLGTDEEVSRGLKLFATSATFKNKVSSGSIMGSSFRGGSRRNLNPFAFYPKPHESHWHEHGASGTSICVETVGKVGHTAGTASTESAPGGSGEEKGGAGRMEGGNNRGLLQGIEVEPELRHPGVPHRVCVLRLKDLSGTFVSTEQLRRQRMGFAPTR